MFPVVNFLKIYCYRSRLGLRSADTAAYVHPGKEVKELLVSSESAASALSDLLPEAVSQTVFVASLIAYLSR